MSSTQQTDMAAVQWFADKEAVENAREALRKAEAALERQTFRLANMILPELKDPAGDACKARYIWPLPEGKSVVAYYQENSLEDISEGAPAYTAVVEEHTRE